MPISASLESKIKGLSDDPGVYLMKDASGVILYVGKAKNLKSRVSSYFQESKDKTSRIELLVRKIYDFEVVITDTEVEALVLECNLIKKYKPRFNIRLKDDKTYPYVRLDLNHPFPRMEYVRKVRRDGARYFGPYVASGQLKDFLRWAQKAFRLRDCSDNEFRNRARPCILYQMGQCSAPCVGLIKEEDYARSVQSVLKLLDGKNNEVLDVMRREMEVAAEREEFELAAALRDRIQHIEALNEEQKITDPEAAYDRDFVHYARSPERGQGVVVVLSVREGRTVGVFQYPFEDVDGSISNTEFLSEFLVQYYLPRYEENPQLLPKEVLMPPIEITPLEISEDPQQAAQVAPPLTEDELTIQEQTKLLSRAMGKRVEFRIPKRGEAAQLVAMVRKTAEHHLSELSTRVSHTMDDLADVQKKLGLRKFPHRIECYDISHFQGEGTVASRVVFIEGKPEKALYRHYHVREVDQPDDFKSLREVLTRRFANDHSMPDLVVIDGGKGQLAQAELIFSELGVVGAELVSIAKARTERSFQDAEVTATMERIFKPNQKNPIMLKPGTGSFRVLTQARDESHRFAITFHRQVRDRRILRGRSD
jgi:excinuclease ABC subunit C